MSRGNFVLDKDVFSPDEIRVIAELVATQSARMENLKPILGLSLLARGPSSSHDIQRALTHYYKPELGDVMSFVFRVFDLNYFPDINELKSMLFEKIAELNLSQAIHSRFKLFFLSDTMEQIIQLAADLDMELSSALPSCALAGLKSKEREWIKKAITLAPADFMGEVEAANDDRAIKTLFLTNAIARVRPEFHAKLFAMWSPADVIKFYEQLNPDDGNEVQAKFRQMQIDRYRAFEYVKRALHSEDCSHIMEVTGIHRSEALLPNSDSIEDIFIFQTEVLSLFVSALLLDVPNEKKIKSVFKAIRMLYSQANSVSVDDSMQFITNKLFHVLPVDLIATLFSIDLKGYYRGLLNFKVALKEVTSLLPAAGYHHRMNKVKSFFLSVLDNHGLVVDNLESVISEIYGNNRDSLNLVLIPVAHKILEMKEFDTGRGVLREIALILLESAHQKMREEFNNKSVALIFPLLTLNKSACKSIMVDFLYSYGNYSLLIEILNYYIDQHEEVGYKANLKNIIGFLFKACQISPTIDQHRSITLDKMLKDALDKIHFFPEQERREFAEDLLIYLVSFINMDETIKIGFNDMSYIWCSFYRILDLLSDVNNEIVKFDKNKLNKLIMLFNNMRKEDKAFEQFGSMEIAFYQKLHPHLQSDYIRNSQLRENIIVACKCGVFESWEKVVKKLSAKNAQTLFFRGVCTDQTHYLPIIFSDVFDPYKMSVHTDAAYSLILSTVQPEWLLEFLKENCVYQDSETVKMSASAGLYLASCEQEQLTHFHYLQASTAIPSDQDVSSLARMNIALIMDFMMRAKIKDPLKSFQDWLHTHNRVVLWEDRMMLSIFKGIVGVKENMVEWNRDLWSRLIRSLHLEIAALKNNGALKPAVKEQVFVELIQEIKFARSFSVHGSVDSYYNELEVICFSELSQDDKARYLEESDFRKTLYCEIICRASSVEELIDKLDEFTVQQLFFRGRVIDDGERLPIVFDPVLNNSNKIHISQIREKLLSKVSREWFKRYLLEEKSYVTESGAAVTRMAEFPVKSEKLKSLSHHQYFNLYCSHRNVRFGAFDESTIRDTHFYKLIYKIIPVDMIKLVLFGRRKDKADVLTDMLSFLLSLEGCISVILVMDSDYLNNDFYSAVEGYCKSIISDIAGLSNCSSDYNAMPCSLILKEIETVMSTMEEKNLSKLYSLMLQVKLDLFLNLPYDIGKKFLDDSVSEIQLHEVIQNEKKRETVFFNAFIGLLLGTSLKSRIDTVSALACKAYPFPNAQKKLRALASLLLLELKLVENAKELNANESRRISFAENMVKLKVLSLFKDPLLTNKIEARHLVYEITQDYTLDAEDLNKLERVLESKKINSILRAERSKFRLHEHSVGNTKSYAMVWSMVKYARARLAIFTGKGISDNSVLQKSIFRLPHKDWKQKREIASAMRGLELN